MLLVLLLYFPLFSHLDVLPIRIWDESRVANNAIEMYSSGDYLVTTYNGEADHWNTKPPLTVWSQVFFMHLVGPNELAVRLPSAIAAFLCCIFLVWFFKRWFNKPWLGVISALILVTLPGFVAQHVSRTGDYDSMLVLFSTMAVLLWFSYSETGKTSTLHSAIFTLTLGVMTKGIVVLIFLPGVLVYLLWQKKVLSLLKNKHFWFAIIGFIVPILAYLLLRERADPGYIKDAYFNDVNGRFNDALDSHRGGFWYYYNYLVTSHLGFWFLLVPIGWFLGLASRNDQIRRLTTYTLITSLTFLLVISLAETKIEWYDAPLLPLLSIHAAITVYSLFRWLRESEYWKEKLRFNPLPMAIVFVLWIGPYQRIIDKTFAPEEISWEEAFYEPEYWLKGYIANSEGDKKISVIRSDYRPHWRFYIKQAQLKGLPIDFIDPDDLLMADYLAAFTQEDKQLIELNFRPDKQNYQYIMVPDYASRATLYRIEALPADAEE